MQIIRLANLYLVLVVLGGFFAWSRADFRVPQRFSSFARLARPAVAVTGWAIMVYLVGDAVMNVVTGYVVAPGVHFYSPYQNAGPFWVGIAVRIAAGILVGGSLIRMARGRHRMVSGVAPRA